MTKYGRVVARGGDGTLEVCFERHSACGKCRLCETQKTARARVLGEAEVGDVVAVSMPDHQVLRASAAAYLVPLCTLIAGLLAGSMFFGGDASALAGALIGLGAGVAAVLLIDRRVSKKRVWHPRVTGILTEDELNAALAAGKEDDHERDPV